MVEFLFTQMDGLENGDSDYKKAKASSELVRTATQVVRLDMDMQVEKERMNGKFALPSLPNGNGRLEHKPDEENPAEHE
jgi:hypothetical protein